VLNTVTVIMAAAGIVLALALARPWGLRIPAAPLLAAAWIGYGLLVPMIPYLLLSSVLGGAAPAQAGEAGGGGAALPAWEAALIQLSFAGMAVGLAVAFPLYLRERWPDAFRGRLGPADRSPRGVRGVALVALLASAAFGVVGLYWLLGGGWGLRDRGVLDQNWRLLTGNSTLWAFAGAAGVWALARRRPARLPLWVPFAGTWVASGMLFAWNCWKLPLAIYLATAPDPPVRWPEHLPVALAVYLLGVAAGVAMLVTTLRAYRRRRADGLRPG
jgi:hypothetical protein